MINVHSNDMFQFDGNVPYCYVQDCYQNNIGTIEIDDTLVTVFCTQQDEQMSIDLKNYDFDLYDELWIDAINDNLFEPINWIVDERIVTSIIDIVLSNLENES